MRPVVFSPSWFKRHQRVLLGLLNAPIIGGELRDVLAIRRCDVGHDRRIVALLPHCYIVANPDGTFTMDVRTHAKYAKRLRYQFDAIWQAAHAWDRFVANPLIPALNLGFDTFTVFPDPDVEITSVDGQAKRGSFGAALTWADIQGGAGQVADDSGATIVAGINGSATTNRWDELFRTLILFDTSPLTGSAGIVSGVLSLFGQGKNDTPGNGTNNIYSSAPAGNTAIVAADYTACGTTAFSTNLSVASFSTAAYNDWVLNATGRAAISLTSISKFSLRNANYDVANVEPTWAGGFATYEQSYSADQIGTANDPKLVVTFNLPLGVRIDEAVAGGMTLK